MERILVLGSSGVGKSTFARKLGALLGREVIHLDKEYWRAGWQATPKDEWRARVLELLETKSWILDGNFSSTLDIRLPACDTIFLLELPRLHCIYRVFRRWLNYARHTRPDMSPGCVEHVDWEFVRYIWNYPTSTLPRILAYIESDAAQGKAVYRFRTARQAEQFLRELEARITRASTEQAV